MSAKTRRGAATVLAFLLVASGARGAQFPALSIPATYSHGDPAKTQGLERQAWWIAFGDPTLDSLVRRAVQGSLSLQQARARILQARASLGSAKADEWPTATASLGVSRSQASGNASSPASESSPLTLYKAGFDATWEIGFLGGKRKAREAAEARLEASVEDLNGAFLTLAGDIATQYVALRGNQTLLEVTNRNAETQRQSVALTEERFRLGLTSGLDVAQAKAQLAATTAEVPTLEASIRQSIHRIGLLLGLEPRALAAELAEPRPLPSAETAIATGLPSELLSRRPDLRSAERNLRAAMADIGVARSDLYPKFDLTLGLGLQSARTGDFTAASSRTWSIVPGLSLPIFNRGALKAALARKEAVYQESLASFQAAYHTALEDVENALANHGAERSRRQALEESLRQSREALAMAQERYQRGLTSFLDVLTAQGSVQSAEGSLAQSQVKVLTHLVSLQKALGGGWAAIPMKD